MHKMSKEQVKEAVELLGQYYGFYYDDANNNRIIIYTDIIKDKNGNLIFESDEK